MTQLFLFVEGQGYQVLDVPEKAESVVRQVNAGNWQRYFPTERELLHADLDGERVIVTRRQPPPTPGKPRITRREQQVLHLLAMGMTTREIAGHISLTERTVRSRISSLRDKLGAQTASQLLAKAVAQGLIEPG